MEAINDYLTQKHYEVKSLEGQAQIDAVLQMQNDISGTEADLPYIAGLSLGSAFTSRTLHRFGAAVGASLSAYRTSTGRLPRKPGDHGERQRQFQPGARRIRDA